MSYILDALRRADSERERGAIPSLHSKPVPPALADAEADAAVTRSRLVLWAGMGVLAVLAGVVVWLLVGRGEPREPDPMPMAAATRTPAASPVAAAAAMTQAPAPASPMPAVPMPEPPPATARAAAAESHTPDRAAAKPAPKGAPAAHGDDDAQAPVPSMASLPDNLRRELPPLTVSGATYSKTASSRMLILNGQVFHEGDKVAGDLLLEQIRLKSAVFSYRGHRFGLDF
ncbi:MAG: general secretion pathway protein GspB [Rhizobacter sp.]|nr:general secretion pathway protein GspB [Rhizobacter sp.]